MTVTQRWYGVADATGDLRGGVLVRRLRGRWWLAAIRPQGKPDGTWALPKALIGPARADETALARWPRRPGPRGGSLEARRRPVRLHVGGRADLQGRELLPPLRYRAAGSTTSHASRSRSPGPLAAARRGPSGCSPTAASARWREGAGGVETTRYDLARLAVYALNFYSPIVADQLRSRRKTATIRLGDKSAKYKKGMVVQVLVGSRYGPREGVRRGDRQGRGEAARRRSHRVRSSTTTRRCAGPRRWRTGSASSTTGRSERTTPSR